MNHSEAYLTFHRFQQSREKFYAPKIYKALRNQITQFLDLYKSGNKDALHHISSQGIVNIIRHLYKDAAITYGAKIRASLPKQKKSHPMGFDERMVALINAYFETDILNTSEGITDTTREWIQEILKEANDGGLGIDFIEQKLMESDIPKSRSRLIARTETVTGANLGGFLGAMDLGLMMNKEWLATGDSRTRPDHVIANGQKIGMLDYFTVGGAKILFPGDRQMENGLETPPSEICNCRCTCLFIPVRVDGRLVEFDYSQFRQLIAV